MKKLFWLYLVSLNSIYCLRAQCDLEKVLSVCSESEKINPDLVDWYGVNLRNKILAEKWAVFENKCDTIYCFSYFNVHSNIGLVSFFNNEKCINVETDGDKRFLFYSDSLIFSHNRIFDSTLMKLIISWDKKSIKSKMNLKKNTFPYHNYFDAILTRVIRSKFEFYEVDTFHFDFDY